MNLGVQYYRPPFPNSKYWVDDFARIKDSGLSTVQLWVLWGWVESQPGRFVFDDYDRLVDLAAKNGLGVILSTIAEIQPLWIHREVPGSELVDHKGNRIVSVSRSECHFGLTPGGCWDNPAVWARMAEFLRQVVTRYRAAPNLRGWDAWNELRWNVHAEALVCYCDHSLAAFRKWLDEKYGGLEGLNRAWIRRYGAWDEVMPGRYPGLPFTEMMAFEHFITAKCDRHAKMRYEVMKGLDAAHPVTVHGGAPCTLSSGGGSDQALNRGNDWFFADALDGVGCSSFPTWFREDDAGFGMRIECVKSAARGKRVWLSEVQGGRAAQGFQSHDPVRPLSQQRWIWNGLACGADTLLFWCWRDEVFCNESAGFGIAGDDGLAEERLAAMKTTGALLQKHKDLLAAYRPAKPEVGVLFSPQSYYLDWAVMGNGDRARQAFEGYARALVRNSIPYAVIEEAHLEELKGLKILFLPRTLVVDDATAAVFEKFVRAGGTLVTESECGAWGSNGLYRYPADRFTARLAGIREIGRRALAADTIQVTVGGRTLRLGAAQWLTPWQKGKGRVLASGRDGPVIVEVPVGKGRIILGGTYLGEAYKRKGSAGFEPFVAGLVRDAGWKPEIEVVSPRPTRDAFVYTKSGESAGRRVLFVFFPPKGLRVNLKFRKGFFAGPKVADIISGRTVAVTSSAAGQRCVLPANAWRLSVLVDA